MLLTRQRLSILLMTLGFGLLLAFVYLFLEKVWDDEVDSLKQETSLLLVNSVRSIERGAFDRMFIRKLKANKDSVNVDFRMIETDGAANTGPRVQIFQADSALFHLEEVKPDKSDTMHFWQTRMQEKQVRVAPDGTVGTLSMIIAIDSESTGDSTKKITTTVAPSVFALLEKKFNETVAASGTSAPMRLVRSNADSTVHADLVAATYTDVINGERFDVVIDSYRKHVLGRIWPQLLFSVLLLALVALAFLFIYQSLLRQSRLTELKDDFIRNMTHELKTPIATVSVAVEALQNFDALQNPQRTQEYLDIAGIELNRLSLLVDKVLRVSLFEKQEPELRHEPLDLKTLVEEILHSMRLQFEKHHARVHFKPEGNDFSISGDRLHLTSVVYNLLDNALKYSAEQPEIQVALTHADRQLSLEVQDNGIGIPAAYQSRIFEKFFRVPTGDVHNVKGHGLGLSYVASVVRLHGGHIEVESREQAGARFTITLPTEKPAD